MKKQSHFGKFLGLAHANNRAALDVNTRTGAVAVMRSAPLNGEEGLGAIPQTYGVEWARIASCEGGEITIHGSHEKPSKGRVISHGDVPALKVEIMRAYMAVKKSTVAEAMLAISKLNA